MIPLLGLLVGSSSACCSSRRCRWCCSRTCRSPSWPRWTRCSAAFRAYLEGIFTDRVFVVSFISNVLIAALIVWVGDQIGVGSQLSTAVVVVLGIRIFTNAAAIRRALFHA